MAVRVAVPAHITGFFSVHRAGEPRESGSCGAGVTLADAVTVTVHRGGDGAVVVNDEAAEVQAVGNVLDVLDVDARIEAMVDVPIGAGFGVSGALALGTAVGANQLSDQRRSENELVGIAHAADVRAGTGLGDVVAQHRGGAPIRLSPGAPETARLDAIPDRRPVEWVTFGELSTEAIIGGETDAIDRAGGQALQGLLETPTLDQFMQEAGRFAASSGLLTDRVREVMDAVAAHGGQASMAMLGNTVFALGTDLSDAGYEPTRAQMAPTGVTVLTEDGAF